MSNASEITLTINGEEKGFEIRTPSLFNRNQFFMLLSSCFATDDQNEESMNIDLEDIFALSQRDFMRFLKASLKDDNNLVRFVDLETGKNFAQAQLAVRSFFLRIITTFDYPRRSTSDTVSSSPNTTKPYKSATETAKKSNEAPSESAPKTSNSPT